MKPRAFPGRYLVVASLPALCAPCAGDGVMRLVRVDRVRGAGRVLCPHCRDQVPVLYLPMLDDRPRGETA